MKRLILGLLFCSNIVIASSPLYVPQVELDLQIGKSRNYGRASVLVPFAKDGNSLPFLNVFGLSDSLGASEGNIGLGYRRLYSDAIYGGYVFYDKRKSKLDNMYQQLTFGAEYLLQNFEARVNGYAPIGKSKNITANSHMERSLPGFDIELGGNLLSNLEGYVSFYYFGDKDVSMPGYRLRSVYSINSNVKLLGEISHDKIRGFNYFAGIKLRASLGSEKGLSGLEKKMVQNVVRDIDIVIDDKEETPNFILKGNVNVVSGVELLGEDISIIEEFIAELDKLKSDYSDSQEINRVYRRLSLKYHPDRKNGSDASFVSLSKVRDGLLQNSSYVINFVNEYHVARKIQSVYRGFAARASLETGGISLDSSGSNIMSNGRKVQVGKLSDGSHLIYDGSDLQVMQDSAINVVENHGLFQEGLQSGREVSFKSLVKNTKFVNGSLVPKGRLRGGMPGAAEADGSGSLSGGAAEEPMSDEDAEWHGDAFIAKLQWAVDKLSVDVDNDEQIMVFIAAWESRIVSKAHIDNMVDLLNIKSEDDDNILHLAARYGRVSVLQWIYNACSLDEDRRALLTQSNANGSTIAHVAAVGGHVSVLQWIYYNSSSAVDRRALLTQAVFNGSTIFHCAAFNGHVPVLQWIYNAYSSAADRRALLTQADGYAIAHLAAIGGHVSVLQWIYDAYSSAADRQALLTQGDRNGDTIYHLAASSGYVPMLQWIYDTYSSAADRQAHLTYSDDRWTIFHLAAFAGHVPVLQWIYDNYSSGADRQSFLTQVIHIVAHRRCAPVVLNWILQQCSFFDGVVSQGLSAAEEPGPTGVVSLSAVLSAVPHAGDFAGKSIVQIIAEKMSQKHCVELISMSPSKEMKELFVNSIMRNQVRLFPNVMNAHDVARISNQSCLYELAGSQDGRVVLNAQLNDAIASLGSITSDSSPGASVDSAEVYNAGAISGFRNGIVAAKFLDSAEQWQARFDLLPDWVKESRAAKEVLDKFNFEMGKAYAGLLACMDEAFTAHLSHLENIVSGVHFSDAQFMLYNAYMSIMQSAMSENREEEIKEYCDKAAKALIKSGALERILKTSALMNGDILFAPLESEGNPCAIKIQSLYRGFCVRSDFSERRDRLIFIKSQSLIHKRAEEIVFSKSTQVQSLARCKSEVKKLASIKKGIIKFQAISRGWAEVIRFALLKNEELD